MKASLESEIEDCSWAIDNILENRMEELDFISTKYIDGMVAHYLQGVGDGWVYNDEFSGPQLNEISEKALMKIVDNKIVYHQKFQIVSVMNKGTRYFKAMEMEPDAEKVKYIEITPEDVVIGMQPDDLELLKYKN